MSKKLTTGQWRQVGNVIEVWYGGEWREWIRLEPVIAKTGEQP